MKVNTCPGHAACPKCGKDNNLQVKQGKYTWSLICKCGADPCGKDYMMARTHGELSIVAMEVLRKLWNNAVLREKRYMKSLEESKIAKIGENEQNAGCWLLAADMKTLEWRGKLKNE